MDSDTHYFDQLMEIDSPVFDPNPSDTNESDHAPTYALNGSDVTPTLDTLQRSDFADFQPSEAVAYEHGLQRPPPQDAVLQQANGEATELGVDTLYNLFWGNLTFPEAQGAKETPKVPTSEVTLLRSGTGYVNNVYSSSYISPYPSPYTSSYTSPYPSVQPLYIPTHYTPIQPKSPIIYNPTPSIPGLLFSSYDQARHAAMTRNMAQDYIPLRPDPTIPNENPYNVPSREYYVSALIESFLAVKDSVSASEKQSSSPRWQFLSSGYTTLDLASVETVCWHLVFKAEALHSHGSCVLLTLDQDKLRQVKNTQHLTFAARIGLICELLRVSKTRCDLVLKEELDVVVGLPDVLIKQSKENSIYNGARTEKYQAGRKASGLGTPGGGAGDADGVTADGSERSEYVAAPHDEASQCSAPSVADGGVRVQKRSFDFVFEHGAGKETASKRQR